ncbi:MAG TPA: histidine kinase dimerization/phosphoacceptor domain -containing protein [Magnetospirillum sp.]|nr:histidine kinase dimerization/phosphoacceptor domain -containing protein [Magnetospirillum sp.]
MIGAFGLSAWYDHELSRQDTETDLTELTRLMEQHTLAALQAGELQIARIRDYMGTRLPSQMGGPADQKALARITSELPLADSAWIFDADANMRASSHELPPSGLNVADRAYYTAVRDGAAKFISPLIWGRLRKGPFLAMSRRVEGQDGRFAGGVQISLQTSYFTDFYRNLSSEPGVIFAIYKDDGNLVMRSALAPGQESVAPPVKLLGLLKSKSSGTFQTVSTADGVERLYVFRRIEGHPLVVISGVPVPTIYAGWRDRTLRNGIIAACILAAFLVIAAKLADTLRREAGLRARAETLLADKDVLFQEIHHRVKNNLQIVASFLTMQGVRSRDPAVATAFEEALSRLQSMGLVHQILYEQNEASHVSMEAYLRALSMTVGQTFGADLRGIHVEVAPSEVCLPMDTAVPLALLANEALTNALKHAFPPGRGGRIRMELTEQDDKLAFTLCDDGVGMEENAKSGLGMTILSALSRQLEGSLEWVKGQGTCLVVTFPACP